MKSILAKTIVGSLLLAMTVVAYGGSFHGWFLPDPLKKPVSLRDGSTRGKGIYFLGMGRSHYGGGYRGGK